MKKMLLMDNELPDITYKAKKVICAIGLDVQKIHVCINDCILYRGEEYEDKNECLVCDALQYKIRYLFRNKEHTQLQRWPKEDRKKDEMLRHPADGWQWKKMDREYKDFTDDAKNLRFGLNTDGINPFGEQSCSHSTWPVILCIYNLSPWLCMKRKFIMMPVLIQGPKQIGRAHV